MKDRLGKAALFALLIVGVLTLLLFTFQSSKLLFYSLFPGVVLGLAIAGFHGGGTALENITALAACVLVNTVMYALLITIFLSIQERSKAR
jgi:hypothetical protein